MSHITTHILDTAAGNPAQGVSISLEQPDGHGGWIEIAQGVTNEDGRIGDLLPEGKTLRPGMYRMLFRTGAYFQAQGLKTFYPEVPVVFEVFDDSHYHVPLLLNPFGYSTYRRVLGYYSGENPEDALDMRKALPRDKDKESIVPLEHPVHPEDLEW